MDLDVTRVKALNRSSIHNVRRIDADETAVEGLKIIPPRPHVCGEVSKESINDCARTVVEGRCHPAVSSVIHVLKADSWDRRD